MDIATLQSYTTLIKDIVTIASTIALAVVAIFGLSSWKRQQKGQNKYEVGRKLLLSIYKLKYAVQQVRDPLVLAAEIYTALQEQGITINESDSNWEARSEYAVYIRRWKLILDVLPELDLHSYEAEILWGEKVKERTQKIYRYLSQLRSYIDDYLELKRNPEKWDMTSEEMHNRMTYAIFATDDPQSEKKNNWFTMEFDQSISQIEQFLKQRT